MTKHDKDQEKIALDRHKNAVWKKYHSWSQIPILCPALKCEVRATLKGWKHISGEGKKRSIEDCHRRLRLIEHAIEIIKKSSTIQDISSVSGRTHYAFESVETLKDNPARSFRIVRVVLEEQRNGNVVFLSVMDRKIRS